jgi:hypothetical protein
MKLNELEDFPELGNTIVIDGIEYVKKREPVAWCQLVDGKIQDLLTSFEMKDWLYDKSWIPLYTSPPTRDPFEPEERQRLSKAYSTRAEQVAFEEGIIFAEISYGIGEG